MTTEHNPAAPLPARTGPALETTTDTPYDRAEPLALNVSNHPVDVRDGLATVNPNPEDPAPPPEPAEEKPAAPEPVAAPKEPVAETPKPAKGVQKRLDELTAQRRAAEERATRAEAALAEIATRQATPADPAATEPARPKRDAFENPDAYDDALIEWSSARAGRAAQATVERETAERSRNVAKTEAQSAQDAEFKALAATYQERRAKALEEMPDYAEVAESDDVQITPQMGHAIMQAENGPKIAYYLGNNKEEAARIASLPMYQQFLEIGSIGGRLSAPKQASVSRTPAPIKPVAGNTGALDKSPAEESMAEYAARRNREIASKRRPFLPSGTRPN